MAGAEVHDKILGEAGHRKPDQGRLDCRSLQHLPQRDSAEIGRATRAQIGLVKVKDEGYGEDRDDNHQPPMMFAKNSNHKGARKNSEGAARYRPRF